MNNLTPRTWNSLLNNNDMDSLWRALNRLVSVHPLVRSAQRNRNSPTNPTPLFSVRDLTQDLYVTLLEKDRFGHYQDNSLTDAEIEREIFQIELTNLLVGQLRRQRPENYRIVRRINQILETSPCFRRFDIFTRRKGSASLRPARDFFGLSEWEDDKPVKDGGVFQEYIAEIPVRMRNRRLVGCRGEAQVIITTSDLTVLLTEILKAINSPVALNTLRTLTLSKLPVYDLTVTAIDEEPDEHGSAQSRHNALTAREATPEQISLRLEQETLARHAARDFLDRLRSLARFQHQRTERYWRILWHSYFDPSEPSQLSIAEKVGLSDSSVSDYRRRIESELSKLGFAQEQVSTFADELDKLLRIRLSVNERNDLLSIPTGPSGEGWLPCNYPSMALDARTPVV
jgi:hypothetical protein